MNKLCIVGRLTKDPELKETKEGLKVANITLAIDRDYKDKDGNKITDFVNFSLWNKLAERIVKFSNKGSLISLEGRLTSKEIETKDNIKVHIIQPVIEKYTHINKAKNDTLTTEHEEEISK